MNTFIWGAIAMACGAVGLFFFRSWQDTKDRLFALFGAAFWLLAVHWVALAILGVAYETRHYVYFIRLIAFLLILGAVVDKNRASTR